MNAWAEHVRACCVVAVFVATALPALAVADARYQGPDPAAADIAWLASGEFCEPETVLALPDDTLLVSNVCGFGEPGTGFLSLLDANGDALDWQLVKGLDAPLGMTMQGDELLVVDSNRLRVFDWRDWRLLRTIELDTRVANDVAVDADGRVYVTDTAAGEVVVLDEDGGTTRLEAQVPFTGANGIEYAGGLLYIGGARLWRFDLVTREVRQIGPDWLVDIDGIEVEADGTLQVTPVAGPLIRLRVDAIEVLGGEGVSSANHGFAERLGLALIPTGYDNSVIAIRVGPTPPAD